MPEGDVKTGGCHVPRGLTLAVLVALAIVALAHAARQGWFGATAKAGFAGGAAPCVGCGGFA